MRSNTTTNEYYEVTVEIAGREPNFWYTIKLPLTVDGSVPTKVDFEELAWYSMLVALEDREDLTDRYAVRESMKIERVKVETTVEREKIL